MIRVIAWLLCMGTLLNGYSQVITITDKSERIPLEMVTISSSDSKILVVTNSNGQADISEFKGLDSINIRLFGYEVLTASYEKLKETGFNIQLSMSENLLDEVVVSSYQDDISRQTSLHIEPLHLKEIEQLGSFNITDALSRVPGVSQLSTGIGISKPVIRGLYGNRILVLFSGLRFDNQQWQDEHGLGLSDIGISRVEVIKGPLSMLYGTDAIGGVINIIEETPPKKGSSETEASVKAHSNTLGGTIQIATKANYGKKWYKLRVAADNHADYSDGNNNRVLNSRFNGYYLKSTYGFQRKKWKSENHYHFSYNNFGFVFAGFNSFFEPDARWSREMSGPHHIVLLNMLSSINHIQLRNSKLQLNAGFQSNLRAEDEGGSELSLIMHLITGQYALKWKKILGKKLFLVVANNGSVENNTNYGKRKIVPDAWIAESAVSAYLKHLSEKIIFEYGLGVGTRYIKTLETKTVNSAEKDISPFEQIRPFYNGMLGTSYLPNDKWNIKVNLSTGVRSPNLAELSSNGLHEGIYTYEIGDPDMKNEQNINGDISIYHFGKFLEFSVSGFYNHFNGYIYLEPTSEEWFGFPIYRFKQYDAQLYGSESTIKIKPSKEFEVSASYSELIGRLYNGEYLPYMPAQKIKPEIRYNRKSDNSSWYCFINNDFVLEQNLINSEENTTPSYNLLNAGIGATLKRKKTNYSINVSANNLLNEAYYDHMSRFKNFGLLNMGRNISINLKINFSNNLKSSKNENKN